jgi:L-2,4-diaminobutyrate decarboxylase
MNELNVLRAAYEPDAFRTLGHKLVDRLADYLEHALRGETGSVLPSHTPDALFRKYSDMLHRDESMEDWMVDVLEDSNHLHHPGYMGHQVCPPVPVASLAALAGTLINNSSAVYEMGMANVAMEKVVLHFLADAMGFPEASDGILTSGGTLGNLTALLAARQQMAGYDTWTEGVRGNESPVFLVSAQAHYSIDKAIRIMGMGECGVVAVPTDERFRMRMDMIPGLVEELQGDGRKVIGIIANAGSTATGSYDDLSTVAELCETYGLWMHVDGAHGAPAVFSQKYRHLATGIELADSVVVDFHKMAMAPSLSTAVLFRNGDHSYETFAQKASYLFSKEMEKEWYNFARRTLECTKSMMGFPVYSILKTHGSGIFDANVTRLYDLSRELYTLLEEKKEIETAHKPESNILVFRYKSPEHDEDTLNRINTEIRRRVIENGNFYIVQTKINDCWYLRVTVMNPFTDRSMFRKLIEEITDYGKNIEKK